MRMILAGFLSRLGTGVISSRPRLRYMKVLIPMIQQPWMVQLFSNRTTNRKVRGSESRSSSGRCRRSTGQFI